MHRIDYPMAENAETLVNEIKSLQGDVPTYLYARIWKHEVRDSSIIEHLFRGVGTKPLDIVRKRVITRALKLFKIEELHHKLMESIDSENENLRWVAISKLPATEKYEDVILQAVNDDFFRVRETAISMLSRFKDATHKETIESALLDESLDVRKIALSSMRFFESRAEFSNRIFDHFFGDDSDLRSWAQKEILNHLSEIEISNDMIEKTKVVFQKVKYHRDFHGDSNEHRLACVKIVATRPAMDEIDFWTKLIQHSDAELHSIALGILSELDDQRAIDALILELSDRLFHRRANAAHALTNHGGSKALQAFDSIRQKNEDVYLLPHIEAATRDILQKREENR